MAEEWIEKLAKRIIEKDHKPAEDQAIAEHKAKVIEQKAPILWRDFAAFFEQNVIELIVVLGQDITYTEAPIKYNFTPVPRIAVAKAAFPYVKFDANPDFKKGTVHISYAVFNPNPPTPSFSLSTMPCRFELDGERIILQLDGKSFYEAKEAATYITEKLFTVN